jgi:Lipase (class 3)
MVFNPNFAIMVGNAVLDAYAAPQKATIADYKVPDGFTIHDVIRINDDASQLPLGEDPVSFGYVAQHNANPTLGLIVLRGTDDMDEWIEDAKCLRRNWSPTAWGKVACAGEVADGFADLEASAHYSLPSGVETVAIVGHSLGSALAVLIAMQIQAAGVVKPNCVYLFACPNVGSTGFAGTYNRLLADCTFRIVIPQDIVPHLPPRILGYATVGQDIVVQVPKGTKPSILTYHSMVTYIAGIKDALDPRSIAIEEAMTKAAV